MSDRGPANAPIRHLAYASGDATPATGRFFGDHYVTQDRERFPMLAEQFDITVFTDGDKSLPASDPFSYEPHVEIRVFVGAKWETRSRTLIGR